MADVPLAEIFNKERKYLFNVERNLRGYEWGFESTMGLFEDIKDLDARELDQILHLDLGKIYLTPTNVNNLSEEQKKIVDNTRMICRMFDVHDGQQRLVTLSILLAALRDAIEAKHLDCELPDDIKGVLKDTIDAIAPPGWKRSDCRVPRVVSYSAYLEDLLVRTDPHRAAAVEPSPQELHVEHLNEDQKMKNAYQLFRQHLGEMDFDSLAELFMNFKVASLNVL